MKNNILIAIFLLLSFTIKSQNILLEHGLPELPDGRNYEKINVAIDSLNGKVYVIMLSKKTLHCIKISMPAGTVEGEITGNIAEDDDIFDYYGATIHKDTVSLAYKSRYKAINTYTLNFGNGAFLSSFIEAENKGEKILNAFVWQNRLCYLKEVKKRNNDERLLQVNVEADDGFFKSTDFHFSRDKSIEKRKGGGFSFGASSLLGKNYQLVDIPAIRPKYPNTLNYIKYHIKQYNQDNKLVVTEDYDNVTEVFEMDMQTKQSAWNVFTKINHTDEPEWVDCSNSFLLDDNLFQVELFEAGLLVSIHNLHNTNFVKIFRCNEKMNDFGSQTNFISENHEGGLLNFRRDDKTLDGVKAFLSKLKNNPAGITAEKVNNSIKLTIGVLKTNTGSMMGPSGAGGGFANVGTGQELSTNAVYFNAFLDSKTFNTVVADTLPGNVFDKVEDVFGKPQEKVNEYSLINFSGVEYLCYYNQRKNKIFIIKSQL